MISGRCRLRVRYSDTDAMAVAHHSRHVNWMETGRVELLRAAGGSYAHLEADGIALPVIGLELRFKAVARFDDVVEIETSVESVSALRVAFAYRITRLTDGTLLATGRTEHCAVDRGTFRPQRLPERLQALLAAHQVYPVANGPC